MRSVTGRTTRETEDTLAVEGPLAIQIVHGPRGARTLKDLSVTMRTPGADFELAAGFLLTEGILQDAADMTAITNGDAPNTVRVELGFNVTLSLAGLERNFYTTSSCGICGKASLLALQTVCPPRRRNTFRIDAGVLYTLPALLRGAQDAFDATGGMHAAGLFDCTGRLHAVREDVGRHNAVDKLFGAEFLADRIPLRDRMLLLSGRASFELLQKALMAGIPMVASVGAPSSLAVNVARQFDIVLVGFLRDGHFNIYHGADHITGLGTITGLDA